MVHGWSIALAALSLGATAVVLAPGAWASPDPLPRSVVLADRRAGDDSLFIYPWCWLTSRSAPLPRTPR